MELPLTREAFRHALKMGYGRAVLHLRAHPELTYEEEILYALTHNQSYDLQIEGTRRSYLLLVMHAAGRWAQMKKPLIEAMLQSEDSADVCSMLDLVSLLARTDHADARDALYEKLRRFDTDEPIQPFEKVIEVDGIEGFKRGACIIGETIATRGLTDFEKLEIHMYDHLRINLEEIDAWLESLPPDHPAQRVFEYREKKSWSECVTEDRAHRQAKLPQMLSMTYPEFSRDLNDVIRFARRWSDHASPEDLELAAQDLISSENDDKRKLLLTLFAKRPFPLDRAPLIQMTESEDFMLRARAYAALRNVRHESVRQLFMKSIERGDPGFRLLKANFQAGDDELIMKTVRNPRVTELGKSDAFQLHSIGFDLAELCKEGIIQKVSPVAQWVYDYSPCVFCRSKAVRQLIACEGASDEFLQECRFDADDSTRAMAVKALATRNRP